MLISAITLIGTFGYIWIEGYSLLDAFYMTIITIASVGYGLIKPLSEEGKIFTSLLIIFSFGTFAYAISELTRFFISGDVNRLIKNQQLNATLEKLDNHVIVCGYGRNGRQAAEILKQHSQKFCVIELMEGVHLEGYRDGEVLFVHGNATHDDILVKAGIHKAKALITSLPKDADNLFIVLSARALNSNLKIISRASEENSDKKLIIAGANSVIMPDKVGGARMASLVFRQDMIEFLEVINGKGGDVSNFEEVLLTRKLLPESILLKDFHFVERTGVNIIGLKTKSGEFMVNPPEETELVPGMKLFVLGTMPQMRNLRRLLKG
jgi:voltage-gated potassium channel